MRNPLRRRRAEEAVTEHTEENPPEEPLRLEDSVTDLFDAQFYSRAYGIDAEQAWDHYRDVGDAQLYDPSPYFSTSFYRARHPRSTTAPRPGLLEYLDALEAGTDEQQVHPLIDPSDYRTRYPEIGDSPAWVHFTRHGDADGRRPGPDFDSEFYRLTYLPLGSTRPLHHYVTQGRAAGLLPRPTRRETDESARAFTAATGARPVLVLTHDMQHGGGPMTALLLVTRLREQGWDPIVVSKTAGPLLPDFHERASTFVLAEGWSTSGFWSALPPGTPTVGNTVVCADLAGDIAMLGHRVLLLIHELPGFVEQLGCTDALRRAADAEVQLGFALDTVRDATQQLLDDTPAEQFHTVGIAPYEPAPSREVYDDIARTVHGTTDPHHEVPVVAGAGNADHRKGFDIFCQTAAAVLERRPHTRIVWFGGLDPWARALADDALAAGMPLELPGHVRHFQAWIAACDVLLVTSRSDIGPGTVLYAALEGVPTVAFATELGAASYVERVGRLVPPEQIGAAADAVVELLDDRTDTDARARRVTEAKAFDAQAYVARVLEVAHG